jgi:hypothetical protein
LVAVLIDYLWFHLTLYRPPLFQYLLPDVESGERTIQKWMDSPFWQHIVMGMMHFTLIRLYHEIPLIIS